MARSKQFPVSFRLDHQQHSDLLRIMDHYGVGRQELLERMFERFRTACLEDMGKQQEAWERDEDRRPEA